MNYYTKQIKLTNESIAEAVEELTKAYSSSTKKQTITEAKYRIAVEELMIEFRNFYGEDAACEVKAALGRKKHTVELSIPGERHEWVPYEEDEYFSHELMQRLGLTPYYYAYSRGRNKIILNIPVETKKRSMLVTMLCAIAVAVVTGLLLNAAPQALHDTVMNDLFTPVSNKLISILSALATPLVFFAVIDGIVGIGDVRSFGKIGTKLLVRMLLSYAVAILFMALVTAPSFGLVLGASTAAGESPLGDIMQLVLDIIPDNLLMPFTIDNDLQVIAIAIFIGVVILMLGERVSKLTDWSRECSILINKMMSLCTKLLPAIVFFGVANLICGSNAKQLASIGKMCIVLLIACGIFIASMIIRTRIVTKTPYKEIFPHQVPTLVINLTTSSQVAALPENMKCCKEGFRIDEKLVDFGLPLGVVTYMPNGSIFFGITAWALCAAFGVPVTLSVAIRIIVISVILAIAAPPIPGSALVILPIFFASCGIPEEAFPIALIFGTIMGYFMPAFNGFCLQLELLMTAKKLGKISDKE